MDWIQVMPLSKQKNEFFKKNETCLDPGDGLIQTKKMDWIQVMPLSKQKYEIFKKMKPVWIQVMDLSRQKNELDPSHAFIQTIKWHF